jgi:hypothetical protein
LVKDNSVGWKYYNLRPIYKDQGKPAEAEQMCQRALHGREKALGIEHTSTLDMVNSLGVLSQRV